MAEFSQADRARILQALMARAANQECNQCQRGTLALVDGYFNHPLQPDLINYNLGGVSLPSVARVCSNCGFIQFHALGSLGLLNPSAPPEGTSNG